MKGVTDHVRKNSWWWYVSWMISMVLFAESRHFWTHSHDPGTEDLSAGVEVRRMEPKSKIRRLR